MLIVNSCKSLNHNTNYNIRKPISQPVRESNNTSINQTELEYQTLIKTYKSETADVLTDLLNGSSEGSKTSITVENSSRCTMVLTISGNNY